MEISLFGTFALSIKQKENTMFTNKKEIISLPRNEEALVSNIIKDIRDYSSSITEWTSLTIFRTNLDSLKYFIKTDLPKEYAHYVRNKKTKNVSKNTHLAAYASIAPYVFWSIIENQYMELMALSKIDRIYSSPTQIDFDTYILSLAASLNLIPPTERKLKDTLILNISLILESKKKYPQNEERELFDALIRTIDTRNRIKIYFRFIENGYGDFYRKGAITSQNFQDNLMSAGAKTLIDCIVDALEKEIKAYMERETYLKYSYLREDQMEKYSDNAFRFLMHLHNNCPKHLSYDKRDDRFYFPLNYSNNECCRRIKFYITSNAEKLKEDGFVSLKVNDIKRLMKKKSRNRGSGNYNSASINTHLLPTFRIPN